MTQDAKALVARAAALVPLLREHAAASERSRRLAPEVFDALSAADVFRMTAPKRFGGFEADFTTQCEVLAEIARGCGSSSWVATIFSAMSWLVGTLPDEAQEEIFATKDPRVSGVFSPTGKAARRKDGFVLSGRWGFNTGGHGSSWTVVNAIAPNAAGVELPTCMLVRSSELKRLDDWHASGMAATGSSTIVAEKIFVPAYRTAELPAMIEAQYPERHNAAIPITATRWPRCSPSMPAALRSALRARRSRRSASACRRQAWRATPWTCCSTRAASAIQSHVPIQRLQRDMQALANHAVLHPQTTTETYGRVLCGLEPNSPLY